MTHYKLLHPSKYLGAHDLEGKDVSLTIRRVLREELKTERGTEKQPIMYFTETQARAEKEGVEEKRLVLNVTNRNMVASIHGPTVEAWYGKRITLYTANVDAFGKKTDAIRVRPVAPPSASATSASSTPATETK
jgi:hypothetical protein